MSEQHTPEPWWNHNTVIKANGNIPAQATSEANARRIVACVNACAGHSTEQLEKWAEAGGILHLFGIAMTMNQAAALVVAEKQRDDLATSGQRLALELECLLLDTKDTTVVRWDTANEALNQWREILEGIAA